MSKGISVMSKNVSFALALAAALLAATELCAKSRKERLEELGRKLREEGWSVGAPRDATKASSFTEVSGRYCVIRTTAGAEAARDLGEFTDTYLSFFRKIFKSEFRIRGRLTVVVFGHPDEFTSYYRRVYGEPPEAVRSALYSPSEKETWVTLQGEGKRKKLPVETTKHELTHHMLHFFTGRATLPPWFTEGTACFFQYLEISEDMPTNIARNLERADSGDYGYFPAVIRQTFRTPGFVPPGKLMEMDYGEFHTKDVRRERLHYSESWALVYFLTTTKTGQKFFNRIVLALRGEDDLARVLHPKTLASLEKAWYRDIERRFFKGGAKKSRRKKQGAPR